MNVGLVYSGGLSKCAYQVGFTEALLKYLPKSDVKVASGASMGLFTAYALATDKMEELKDLYEQINTSNSLSLFWQVCAKKLLKHAMDAFFTSKDKVSFPVCFPLTLMPILKTKYFWLNGEFNPFWSDYFKAAANFPFVCGAPRFIGGRFATDGGAVDNIPLYPLLRLKDDYINGNSELDLIIVLHFHSRYNFRREFKTDIPVLDVDVSICNGFKKRHFDFSREYVNEMIATSREYGEKIMRRLLSCGPDKKNIFDTVNDIYMSEHERRQQHDSADGLLTVLNAVGKAIRNDRSCSKKLY
ncbi:MAG: patatin-like phospholipase family protein [Clostridia bacterium]|nr:patatin-like phospholipase family protein [Clostridia bacterium]